MLQKRKLKKMKLPKGFTEQQFLAEVEGVVRLLAPEFKTYQDDIEDVRQDMRFWAMEGVGRYNPAKAKLAGFLYVHIRNRMTNARRKQYYCGECPCKLCKGGQPGGTRHLDRQFCEVYLDWLTKNNQKQNVATPTSLANADDDMEASLWSEHDLCANLSLNEVLEKIDAELPLALRPTYLKMRDGVKGISKEMRDAVMDKVAEIIGRDEGVDDASV